MLNKRLLTLVDNIGKRLAGIVLFQWLGLICNIFSTLAICLFINYCYVNIVFEARHFVVTAAAVIVFMLLRSVFTKCTVLSSVKLTQEAKKTLRNKIFNHLTRLGSAYNQHISTAEAVQVSVEGVDQLESYFGAYLPQLFYAVLAPITLFAVILFLNVRAAVVLIICVPLIPLSIIAVQKLAKKLLGKYWTAYTDLGDSFLENIQGLTTLKIYRADEQKHLEMNERAELFRKATMRVLIMQLNSVSVMDIVAYGGAAAGIIAMLVCMRAGNVSLFEGLAIVLLSAEFFIPMRQLGSFFHVAMNGAAAADRVFKILDTDIQEKGTVDKIENHNIEINSLSFAYEANKNVLDGISLSTAAHGLYTLAGKSGCGKSTLAAILTGRITGYEGEVKIGSMPLKELSESCLTDNITLINHNSYIFKGTVRDNLKMANSSATDAELSIALKAAQLSELSLDLPISEEGASLSGGQRQRLALARAIVHNTPIYIFDEATSNIDAESEEAIMRCVRELAKTRLVLLISHRLANAVGSDKIFVFDGGRLCCEGTHGELISTGNMYSKLYNNQMSFEKYGKEGFKNEE